MKAIYNIYNRGYLNHKINWKIYSHQQGNKIIKMKSGRQI